MDLASASRDTCCDVEEGEPETLAPTGRERLGQRENPDPAGDVVGERRGEPPAPVTEEALQRSVVQPEIVLELADCFLWSTTAQTMVVLDRRDVTEVPMLPGVS